MSLKKILVFCGVICNFLMIMYDTILTIFQDTNVYEYRMKIKFIFYYFCYYQFLIF